MKTKVCWMLEDRKIEMLKTQAAKESRTLSAVVELALADYFAKNGVK